MLVLIALIVLAGAACRHMEPGASANASWKPIYYTCPLHPSVKVAAMGSCPLCASKLVPAFSETDSGTAAPCGALNCAPSPPAK